jgi:DNA (cytosine-5)-methyltransferase 3A
MNVLSLFDGMSCGQIALDQLGIPVDNYYASEIDKYAIEISKKNYPNTIYLGDVTKVKGEDLEKIDLLLGGSPCQGFSFAGKQLNFDDPRSALFFEFVRLLKECNPKYFLLENVRMKKEYQDVITEHLGVEPIMINSALVSAQNRVRLYWTNIPNITQPEDRDIVLKDILENGIATDEMTTSDKKSFCLTARYQGAVAWNSIEKRQRTMVQVGMANDINGHDILKRIYSPEGKSPTLNAHGGGNTEPKVACGALRGRQITPGSKEYTQMLELREDDKTNTLTSVQKDNVLTKDKMYYRKLTPLECERLQTVPDGYTEGVSNTQRYKMLGNGWTIEVIKHVLQNIT